MLSYNVISYHTSLCYFIREACPAGCWCSGKCLAQPKGSTKSTCLFVYEFMPYLIVYSYLLTYVLIVFVLFYCIH